MEVSSISVINERATFRSSAKSVHLEPGLNHSLHLLDIKVFEQKVTFPIKAKEQKKNCFIAHRNEDRRHTPSTDTQCKVMNGKFHAGMVTAISHTNSINTIFKKA